MSWLAPLFLVGLAGLALPWWLHRLQRKNPARQPLPSTMLLATTERRLLVQKRLRYLLLLAARLAFIALLALAFAQPVWRLAAGAQATARPQLLLIVIDTSLSMQAGGEFAAAQRAALAVIGSMDASQRALLVSAGDTLAVIAAGGSNQPTRDRNALRSAVRLLRPGEGRLDFSTVTGSLEALAGDERGPVVAHFISDFQQSAAPLKFAELVPRAGSGRSLRLELHAVGAASAANWRVASIATGTDGIDVVVRGLHTPARRVAVTLAVNDMARGRQEVLVPAEGSVSAHFPAIKPGSGESRISAGIVVDDALAADNTRYAVLQDLRAASVPLLSADPQDLAARYLDAAFIAAGRHYQIAPHALQGFDARTLERDSWVIVDDLGAADANLVQSLRSYLMGGGAVFAALGPRVVGEKTVPLSGESIDAVPTRTDEPMLVGATQSAHPVLARTQGWGAVSVARLAVLTPARDDRVLLATESGQPLLIERAVGAGRLLLWTSSLDNQWNDLPLQPVFVGFVAQLADYLAQRHANDSSFTTGSRFALTAAAGGGQIIDPAGHEMLGLADTGRALSVRLGQSGFYQVITASRERLLAVNPDARESDLVPLSAEFMQQWRAAASSAAPSAPGTQGAAAGPQPVVELWRWLLLALGLAVVAESALGMLHLRAGGGASS